MDRGHLSALQNDLLKSAAELSKQIFNKRQVGDRVVASIGDRHVVSDVKIARGAAAGIDAVDELFFHSQVGDQECRRIIGVTVAIVVRFGEVGRVVRNGLCQATVFTIARGRCLVFQSAGRADDGADRIRVDLHHDNDSE